MGKQPKPYIIKHVEEPVEHWVITTPMGGLDVAVDAVQALTKAVQMAANEEPGIDPISIRIAWLEAPEGFEPPGLDQIIEDEIDSDTIN